jgi:hypothetical protein
VSKNNEVYASISNVSAVEPGGLRTIKRKHRRKRKERPKPSYCRAHLVDLVEHNVEEERDERPGHAEEDDGAHQPAVLRSPCTGQKWALFLTRIPYAAVRISRHLSWTPLGTVSMLKKGWR